MADDDWDVEPDYVNDVTEKEQRWGSKSVPGSGRLGAVDMSALRNDVIQADRTNKLKTAPKPSFGYGGKFGVEKDRVDKAAVGWDHHEQVDKHSSQKDYSTGFGGKFGVQTDRKDKSAVGWDHKETVDKHSSQKDYTTGFGGKYGVQKDRQDKSAVGWDYRSETTPHASQTDYSKGFGGKYGLQTDRADSSAASLGQDDAVEPHPSQQKADIPQPTRGSLASIRERFEAQNRPATQPSNEPSAAQKRVLEERAQWDRERAQAASHVEPEPLSPEVPPAPPQLQPMPTCEQPQDDIQQVQEMPAEPIPPPPTNIPEPPAPPAEQQYSTAIALYDYTAADDDELTFSVGELITEIEKIDVGWWKGVCRGIVGVFPNNYVQEQ